MVKVFDKINASKCFKSCYDCKMEDVCFKIAEYNPCFYKLN